MTCPFCGWKAVDGEYAMLLVRSQNPETTPGQRPPSSPPFWANPGWFRTCIKSAALTLGPSYPP